MSSLEAKDQCNINEKIPAKFQPKSFVKHLPVAVGAGLTVASAFG
jgi:hypothetical protein